MGEPADELDQLRDMINASERMVVFTGAGASTESGIPDFRSPGGIWTKYQPIDFNDFMASEEMRRESWRRTRPKSRLGTKWNPASHPQRFDICSQPTLPGPWHQRTYTSDQSAGQERGYLSRADHVVLS